MFVSECLGINECGRLTIGGLDTVDLANKYGTPLYIMDEAQIRKACRLYKHSFERYYDGKGQALYASKALNCKEICRIIKDEGLGLDVVSAGEMYTALKSGFPAERIHFHGNNKTRDEIKMALENDIGKIVIDNFEEIDIVNSMAREMNKSVNISLRIKPGIDAHTHEFIRTGQIDSKFGFALQTGEAIRAVEKVLSLKNVNLSELHCHIGSQIFDIQPFVHAAEVMMLFIKEVHDRFCVEIPELNLGGGFGIKYVDSDKPVTYDKYMKYVSDAVKKMAKAYNISVPYIYIEPGRSIVGEAGITLYTIGSIKDIPDVRTYVSVDGGMTDNPRYALYGSEYACVIADRANEAETKKVTIAGRCCESGDIIQKDALISEPKVGDKLAVLCTGAYNYSMASNYNRVPKPPIIMVRDGKDRIIVRRQTLDDLIENDI